MSNNLKKNDNIRNPDPIKMDKLIDDFVEPLFEDNQLKEILELSKNEFNNLQDVYEKKIINSLIEETKERSMRFTNIKQKLNKMLVFDKENRDIYENMLSIIEFYIEGYITQYKSNSKEFKQIFDILKTIRLTNEELKCLQNLIVIEE